MKKQIIIAVITLLALAFTSNAQQKIAYTNSNTVNETNKDLSDIAWIEKAIGITVKDNDIPSVTVGIVRNGNIVKFISKGVLKRGTNAKADENTIFQIGSLTKSFTGIIANNLIEEGKLNPEASIIDYLPNSLSPKAISKLRAIAVKNLLHHQSGIPRDSKVYHRFGNDPMVCCYTEKDLLTDLEVMELDFIPGEKSEYSNMGFAVLGYLMERASGKTYEELVQVYVAEKYNLKNTTTEPNETQKNFVATPYRKENRKYETKAFEMGKMVSGGGIYSTVADLSKLLVNQMADYQLFLRKQTESPLVLTKYTKPFNQRLTYGYGLFKTNEGRYGHGGDVDGFASAYTFIPSESLGLVMLTSSGGRWVGQLENVIQKKLRNLPVEMPSLTKTISMPKEKLLKYTGTFKVADDIFNFVQNGDRLEAYIQSSFGPYEISFESETKVFSKTYGHTIEFEFGDNDEFIQAFYISGEQKIPMQKIH